MTLAKGQFINISAVAERPFSHNEIEKIVNGNAVILVVIHIQYLDVFNTMHYEDTAVSLRGDQDTLRKLLSNYDGKDLEVLYARVEGYGRST